MSIIVIYWDEFVNDFDVNRDLSTQKSEDYMLLISRK